MRLKKGFTLAEILIVLMVIGVIATMTIPSMMKGVTEAQLKAGYKKAYNTISNFAAMERVAGALPSRGTPANIGLLYQALNNTLSVKNFSAQAINSGEILTNADANHSGCANMNQLNTEVAQIGTAVSGNACLEAPTAQATPATNAQSAPGTVWIVTEDNMAYTLTQGGRTTANCSTKQEISAMDSDDDATDASCVVVVVDVNGLSKGPNTYETQGLGTTGISANTSLNTLTGDQYKIYLGIDGATAGPKTATVTGRIAADLK